jgi:hypothetical protein
MPKRASPENGLDSARDENTWIRFGIYSIRKYFEGDSNDADYAFSLPPSHRVQHPDEALF